MEGSAFEPRAFQGLVVDVQERRRLLGMRLLQVGCTRVVEAQSQAQALHTLMDRAVPLCRPWLILLATSTGSADSASFVAQVVDAKPESAVVGVGMPSNLKHLFELVRAGIHEIVPVDPSVDELSNAIRTLHRPNTLRQSLKPLVGTLTWKEIQARVRDAVVEEALERNHGSRRAAARMLGLSRTAVQRILRTGSGE